MWTLPFRDRKISELKAKIERLEQERRNQTKPIEKQVADAITRQFSKQNACEEGLLCEVRSDLYVYH